MRFGRGSGGFKRRGLLYDKDGDPVDLNLLTTPIVTWHFKDRNGVKRNIIWNGVKTIGPEGVTNGAGFDVPVNFFNVVVDYESSFELKDGIVLLLHEEKTFTVEVYEPAGVSTDT